MMQSRTRLYFALGNLGRTAFYTFFTGFLLSFVLYTRTMTPAQFSVISVVLVAGRLFDAVIDPFIGGMVENTRGRFGRFKPWITVGMVCSAAGTVLLFALPLQGWAFVALLAAGNTVFSLFFSVNDIAFWGMLPALTTLPEERAKLTSLTTLCGGIGGAAAFALVPMLTNGAMALGGSAVIAFPVLAVLFGLLMCGTQLFSLLGVKDPHAAPLPESPPEEKIGMKDLARVIIRNDQLLWASLALVLQSLASGLLSSGLAAFYIYLRFGYAGILAPAATAGFAVGGFAVNLFLPAMHKKWGRAAVMRGGTALFLLSNAFVLLTGLLLPDGAATPLFLCFAAGQLFAGFGMNCVYITLLICLTNTVEYNQYKTGKRQEGLVLSVRPFVIQMGSALTNALATGVFLLLGLLQITNGISDVENAASSGLLEEGEKLAQIGALLAGVAPLRAKLLLAALTILPCLFLWIGVAIWRRKYIIDETRYDEIMRAIGEKAAEG